jgi:hypothetical protein
MMNLYKKKHQRPNCKMPKYFIVHYYSEMLKPFSIPWESNYKKPKHLIVRHHSEMPMFLVYVNDNY